MKVLESWWVRWIVATTTLAVFGSVAFLWNHLNGSLSTSSSMHASVIALFGLPPLNLIPAALVGACVAIFRKKMFLILLSAPIAFYVLLTLMGASFATTAVGLGILAAFLYEGIVRPQAEKRSKKIIFSSRKYEGGTSHVRYMLELKNNSNGELVLEVVEVSSKDRGSLEDKIPSSVLRASKIKVTFDDIIDEVSRYAPGYISSTGHVYKGGSWTEKVNSRSVNMHISETDIERSAFRMMVEKKLISADARKRLFGAINGFQMPDHLKTKSQRNEPEPVYGVSDLRSARLTVDRSDVPRVKEWIRHHQNLFDQKDPYAISNQFLAKVMAEARGAAGKDLKGQVAVSSDERGNLVFFAEINRKGDVVLIEDGRTLKFSGGKDGAEALLARRDQLIDTTGGYEVIKTAEYVKDA